MDAGCLQGVQLRNEREVLIVLSIAQGVKILRQHADEGR